jgi:hypothetical protein
MLGVAAAIIESYRQLSMTMKTIWLAATMESER